MPLALGGTWRRRRASLSGTVMRGRTGRTVDADLPSGEVLFPVPVHQYVAQQLMAGVEDGEDELLPEVLRNPFEDGDGVLDAHLEALLCGRKVGGGAPRYIRL